MSEWRSLRFGAVTKNFDSVRVPVRAADRKNGPYPYYGASGVVDHVSDYLFDGDYLLIAEDGENLRTRKTPIAFTASGKFWVNNHAHIVQGQEANIRFLCYVLAETDISGYLSGSTQPKLTQVALNSIVLLLPGRKTQDSIVEILGALDDKIAVNDQMVNKLDQITHELYRATFSHPSRRSLLEGWEKGRLSDLCVTQYGHTASANPTRVGPRFLRVKDINKRNWIEWENVPYCEIGLERGRYSLSVGDVLVARMADPGKSAIIEEPIEAIFASYLVRLKAASLAHAYFVWGFLKSDAYARYIESSRSGSVQSNMNARVITAAELKIPPIRIMQAHLERILPVRRRLLAALKESVVLVALRNTLLPRLMSGKLHVRDAERIVEDVV